MPHTPNYRGRTRLPTPLSSFDPRFRELLLAGANGIIEIPCDTRGEATRLRQRLNQYRYAAKQHFSAEGAEWEPLYRCIVQQDGALLRLRPRDSQFDAALARVALPPTAAGPTVLPSDFLTNLIDSKDTEQ